MAAEWEQLLHAAMVGAKDCRWRSVREAGGPRDLPGYMPVEIALGLVCGLFEAPAKERRISPVALLQLRCASLGLLRANRKKQESRLRKTARGRPARM